ncbi:MAG TPA: iron ABC transporter permease [Deltaproteobacteria bacterium]|nr:iron ABC transporter permease [Deltaproteobacteria bacterium]
MSHRAVPALPLFIILTGALFILALVSLGMGRLNIPPATTLRIVCGRFVPLTPDWSATWESVVWDVRFPRLVAGMLVGGGLALSGASFQGIFRNPLVSPHILGVSAGAGFGAALGLLFSGHIVVVQALAFIFGVLTVAVTYALSRTYRSSQMLMLVLSGIIVGGFFSALLSLVKYIADPLNKMPAIVFWLLGSLNNVSNADLASTAPIFLSGMLAIMLVRWRINLLAMGDDEARALGVHTTHLSALIIFCATVITSAAVSISGVIGWIGLVIPHMGRILVGPDHKLLVPASALLGAIFLVLVDLCSRSLLAVEIPIGILTGLIGAPVFAWLLHKNRSGW